MYIFCNQLFLALTDVTVVALTDASVKVVLYKRCTFCPVFFALSTTEEASHSWGETFGRSEASKAGVWETIGRIMTRPESLKNYILTKYGETTQRTVTLYGKEMDRAARFANHHHFNLRCLKSDIVPPSLLLKTPVNTKRAKAATVRASRIFLQERVKTSLGVKESAKIRAEDYKRKLQAVMREEDLEKVTSICAKKSDAVFETWKKRQVRKFGNLGKRPGKDPIKDTSVGTTWVHNMSKRKLSEAEKKLLPQGPRFAVTPKLNALDFAAPIEAAMQSSNAPPLRIESARLRICNALSKVQKPRSNISTEEWKAMKGLQLDKKIEIIQADKGNATVVLDSTDYDKKVKELLGDETSYSILKDDPTRTTERKLLNLLRDLKKNKQIPEDVYNDVRPSEGSSKPARFYGRLKLHKESKPLRPVV